MTNKVEHIEHLISKSITGNLNEEEKSQLDEWMNTSEDNSREYNAHQELWNKSKQLVLSDAIDIEASLAKTKSRISSGKKKKRWLVNFRQVAAVLVLSIGIASLYHYFISSELGSSIYQDISTAYGTQTSFELPDGTKVWLNSGSHLHFPTSFEKLKERRIVLKGEAYFAVTKNPSKPFVVNTKEIDVKVLGTSFNVSAYEDSPELTVALEEGKVSLYKANSERETEIVSLTPNEIATYIKSQNTIDVRKESYLDKYTAWKEGRMVFFGDRLEIVAEKLEKWYNVDIEFRDSKLKKSRFTGTFENESLEQVLSLLGETTPISYSINTAVKNADGSFTKRRIILSEKRN